jgi:predicted acylesterase/phospholipase RssA
MSSAIPIVFPPVKYNNNLYVDGAVYENIPLNIFKNEFDKTIGITSQLKMDNLNYVNNNIIEYTLYIIKVMYNNYYKENFNSDVIIIDFNDIYDDK